jgi:hypothetical protein
LQAQERIQHAKQFLNVVKQARPKVGSFNTNYRKPHFLPKPQKAPAKVNEKENKRPKPFLKKGARQSQS